MAHGAPGRLPARGVLLGDDVAFGRGSLRRRGLGRLSDGPVRGAADDDAASAGRQLRGGHAGAGVCPGRQQTRPAARRRRGPHVGPGPARGGRMPGRRHRGDCWPDLGRWRDSATRSISARGRRCSSVPWRWSPGDAAACAESVCFCWRRCRGWLCIMPSTTRSAAPSSRPTRCRNTSSGRDVPSTPKNMTGTWKHAGVGRLPLLRPVAPLRQARLRRPRHAAVPGAAGAGRAPAAPRPASCRRFCSPAAGAAAPGWRTRCSRTTTPACAAPSAGLCRCWRRAYYVLAVALRRSAGVGRRLPDPERLGNGAGRHSVAAGPWVGGTLPGYWPLVLLALTCWLGYRLWASMPLARWAGGENGERRPRIGSGNGVLIRL